MEEFNEEELQKLIEEALSENDSTNPFTKNSLYLGLAETDLMESLHKRLSKRFIDSYINDIFQDARSDILSRKIPLSIKELHTVTKNCRKCALASSAELPKWNVESPDLAVVIDSPNISPQAIELLVGTLKDSGFNSEQICLTYVNRCPSKSGYDNSQIINCSSYLHTELQLLNPKLILCLGALSSSVLFGMEQKIKDIRGEIIWLGYWPIMVTYSPNYVLKQMSIEDSSNFSIENFKNDISKAYSFVTKPTKVMSNNDN